MTQNVALIGYGAIAQEVLRTLQDSAEPTISQILVRQARVTEIQAAVGPSVQVIGGLHELSQSVDYVLECAGHEAVSAFGPEILEQGCDFGVISVGALAEQSVLEGLLEAARNGNSRLSVQPGAIGGIDALAAAGNTLEKVSYSSRKPPMSWAGSPAEDILDLQSVTEETAVYSGSARDAAIGFPKNANVVATVALAGIGFDKTEVTLIADPDAKGNTHQITASGPLFDFSFQTRGSALPSNPKTSALTALSAVRAIKTRAPGLVI